MKITVEQAARMMLQRGFNTTIDYTRDYLILRRGEELIQVVFKQDRTLNTKQLKRIK